MTQHAPRPVTSAQQMPHPRVGDIVHRHLATMWREPTATHASAAFAALRAHLANAGALVLDSGCGTGESTDVLARRHPEALVVGIDKSALRLRARIGSDAIARVDNAIWLRADAAALWRLLAESGVQLAAHYLLYPNPWPKAAQLRRRWHAHPAFPHLLTLGGALELRCNWRVYADEFALALHAAGEHAEIDALPDDGAVLSPFERKYRAAGHALWRVRCELRGATAPRR
jgi:tRNA (guanine-N7-)-methyltransferase